MQTKRDKLLTKKTPKQMFGMVAKWQKAKQEIEEEEKRLIMESEAELDRQHDVKQRIDKWKMDQLQRHDKPSEIIRNYLLVIFLICL